MIVAGATYEGVKLLGDATVGDATRIHAQTERDRTTGYPTVYGLGFLVGGYPPLDQPDAFGHFGQQCVVGWADPARRLAAAYVTNGLHEPAIVATRNAEIGAAVLAACED